MKTRIGTNRGEIGADVRRLLQEEIAGAGPWATMSFDGFFKIKMLASGVPSWSPAIRQVGGGPSPLRCGNFANTGLHPFKPLSTVLNLLFKNL
ncbi:MAG TPA: hypothetical protein VG347_18675 [Verrucomicrobiae bacterium]|nr:hypothetical protein [Verrucomicrobiae bacterium]